jgi:hypothetical protein
MSISIVRSRIPAILILVLLVVAPFAFGGVPDYPTAGHWPYGPTVNMEHWASGPESILVFGQGAALAIADVSDPTSMAILGTVNTGFVVEHIDIAADGQMAAVSDREKWITFIDISNRSAPLVVGRYEVEDGRAPYGIAFGTGYLYAAIGPAGLWVIDISNPALPSLAGQYVEPGTDFVFDVEVLGSYAFLADDDDGVTAIDVSNPALPVFASRFTAALDASHISIEGTTAYVSRRGNGIHILDLSAAPTITELGSGSLGGITYRCEPVVAGLVACADGFSGLQLVDVSTPTSPSVVAFDARSMFVVATDGATAFATRTYDTVNPTLYAFSFDTTAPYDAPTELGTLPLLGENVGVAIEGDTVVVGNEQGGAVLVDASDPANPTTLAEVDLGNQSAVAVALIGDTLAYGSFGNDLGLVDLTNPGTPVLLSDWEVPSNGYAADVQRIPGTSSVIIGAGGAGVRIVDLSNPGTPVETGFWEPPGFDFVLHVDKDGDRIVAAGNTDVWVLDASNPALPVEESSFTAPDSVLDVAVDGDIVYLACGTSGVRIWDVSNPAVPVEVGIADVAPTSANGVDVRDDRLYVAADRFWGLLVFDVTDPTDPMDLDFADTPGAAEQVAVSDALVGLADGKGGVRIWGNQTPLLFADGFETGLTSMWSATVQ